MSINNNLVGMGYIKSAYGVKGWLNIKSNASSAKSLADYSRWYLCKDYLVKEVEVLDTHVVNSSSLRVKISGINDRDQANTIAGMEIKIPREKFKLLGKDEYYWVDLIGVEVRNLGNIFIGKVKNLIRSGCHDILVIDGLEKEILIPFVCNYIIDVNLKNNTIISDWKLDY